MEEFELAIFHDHGHFFGEGIKNQVHIRFLFLPPLYI